MDPCIVDDSVDIPTRCSFVIEFIIPKLNFGITNSITKLHLVGISTVTCFQILLKLEFSQQIFENIKFRENASSGSRVVPGGQTDERMGRQTDRHDEASSQFSQLI
jgi:hypothetical protein